MSLMISEVYDAFLAGGTPDEKARKAAEALSAHEGRFAKIEGELLVVKWMVGFNLAATMGILFLLLKH